ncbi:anthranilate synthase component II [Streptomyces thermovulgaris]|uniref:anthranilate synthase component II n=1 Tax=Streptomyces thermovulgaris TaxID=1934 RepID=UPI000A38C902|nr:aminodeoxychorismate/anthranilate synthase component II [Streptomyces thermovulgaris]
MICVIDNYDSFVYNLVQYAGALGVECRVFRNDEVTVEEIAELAPELLLLSPGPGAPDTAGVSLEAVRALAGRVPIFGVCLGHQTIAQAFGARVVHARRPMHGKCDEVRHDGRGVFHGLPSPLTVTRYHSLVVDPATLPAQIEVSAWSSEGEVMALRHRELPMESVQFHPESLFTEHGVRMVGNALETACGRGTVREGLISA